MRRDRKISGTDLLASPVILGTVVAGASYDVPTAFRLYDKFVDIGGNIFDTARVYSDWIPGQIGRSETVIGQWLRQRGRRDDLILCTKGGAPDHTDPAKRTIHRMHRADMRYDLELSLKTLGVDYVDVYFYHRDDGQPVAELIDIMETFRKEGKIRYYGCSNWKTPRIQEAARYCAENGIQGFVVNQPMFNIGCQAMLPAPDPNWVIMDEEMQTYHQESGMTAFAYFSNCSGFFHNLHKYGPEAMMNGKLDELDDSAQQGKIYLTPRCLEIGARLEQLCQKYGATITQAMMNFFMALDFPCFPLYGATDPAHLDDLVHVDDLHFTRTDYIL